MLQAIIDFSNLSSESTRMLANGADWLHLDIMDGHFVPNLTIGAPVVASLRKNCSAFLDCHLMVSNPEQWIQDFAKAGASMYTFHIESTVDVVGCIQNIKSSGMKVGIALKPGTPIESVFPFCSLIDMGTEPGFGGQKFMVDSIARIKSLRLAYPLLDIQVDGGISLENIRLVAEAGANVVVSGTGIFGQEDQKETIRMMRESIEKCL